jgi:hypothetical protein
MMIDGCIESGKDMFQGGAELGAHWSFYAYGLGTATDAMTAIQKAVYEEKHLSLKELADVTSRCMPMEQEHIADTCICCGKPAKKLVYWGKAY